MLNKGDFTMKRYLLILAAALLLLTGCGKQEAATSQAISEGDALEISAEELSTSIKIYSFTVDGLQMEVLAAKDEDGTVRTAFNTCQVCNSSSKAYFEEKGDSVVCQNCGNAFGRKDVGVLSGGCNPYPIFASDREDTENAVRISYDYLKDNAGLFARWKNNG